MNLAIERISLGSRQPYRVFQGWSNVPVMTQNSHHKWRSRTAEQSQVEHISNRAKTIAIEHTTFAAGNACPSPMQACQPQCANAQYNT